jgi:hypothetical protein
MAHIGGILLMAHIGGILLMNLHQRAIVVIYLLCC